MAMLFTVIGVLLVLVVPIGSFLFWLWRRSKREPILLYEPLDIGRVLGRSLSIFAKPKLLLLALFFIAVPRIAISIGTQAMGFSGRATIYGQTPGAPHVDSAALAISSGLGLLAILIGFLFSVPATQMLVGDFEARPVNLLTALRRVPAVLLPVIGLFILLMLGIVLGMILFFWPGLLLLLSWTVAFPVLIIEGRGVIDSLKHSHALSIGSRGRILLILILFYATLFAVMVPLGFFGLRFGAVGGAMFIATQTLYSLLGGLIGCSFSAALYVELRTIRQGATPDGLAEVFA